MKWPADKVERRAVSSLVPYAKNARTHTDEQVSQVAASIEEWGWTSPVLIDPDGEIIAGHCRVMAAQTLGLDEVPVMLADGWSDEQKRAYILADNKLAENAGWDMSMLASELGDLSAAGVDLSLIGFSEDEIANITVDRTEGLTDPDEVPDLPDDPVSKPGDVWMLGKHRLVCGDSTDADTVAKCLNGVEPHLMVTDPPYGVMLDPSWRDRAGINTMGKSGAGGENYMQSGSTDTEARWDAVWALFPGDVCYVWCATSRVTEVWSALGDAGLVPHQIVVWNKGVLTRTRTHYWYTHEFCIYAWRKNKTAHWVGKSGQPTIWDISSPKHIMSGSKEKNEDHPAQKPVECMKRPIENNSSPGQAVYEPFSGSGTTIIAGEMTGRAIHAIEISPAYVDLAVTRWQNFTGEKAVKETDADERPQAETLTPQVGNGKSGKAKAKRQRAEA